MDFMTLSLITVIAVIGLVVLVLLLNKGKVKIKIKNKLIDFASEIEQHEEKHAVKVKNATSASGGLNVRDATGKGIELNKVSTKNDINLTVEDNGTKNPNSSVKMLNVSAGNDIIVHQIVNNILEPLPSELLSEVPKIIFQSNPKYPRLDFSIVNSTKSPIQITSLKIVKAASIVDDHTNYHNLTGPRIKLDWSLSTSETGKWDEIFGEDFVSNLRSGESEAFNLTLECESTLNLIDIEIEFISIEKEIEMQLQSSKIIVVHSPTEKSNGSISIIDRDSALEALINENQGSFWKEYDYNSCPNLDLLYARGSAYLSLENLEKNFNVLYKKFQKSNLIGIILTSFSEYGCENGLPETIREQIQQWISEPNNRNKLPLFDNESFGEKLITSFLRLNAKQKLGDNLLFDMIDNYVVMPDISTFSVENYINEITTFVSRQDGIIAALDNLYNEYGLKAVEIIIALCIVESFDGRRFHTYLLEKLDQQSTLYDKVNRLWDEIGQPNDQGEYDLLNPNPEQIAPFWEECYSRILNQNELMFFKFDEKFPKLYEYLSSYLNSNIAERASNHSKHNDPLVRLLCAKNPKSDLKALITLSKDENKSVQLAIAMNPSSPSEALSNLIKSEHLGTRRWVAQHHNLSLNTITELTNDIDPVIKNIVLERLKEFN